MVIFVLFDLALRVGPGHSLLAELNVLEKGGWDGRNLLIDGQVRKVDEIEIDVNRQS